MSLYAVAWVFASLGLVPLLWLIGLRATVRARETHWWWLSVAFAVSFVADVAAFFLEPSQRWIVSATYPLSQAALVGYVLILRRRDALRFVGVLSVVVVVAILWRGVSGPDVFFRTVAWGTVVGIAYPFRQLGRLRTSLLVYFGLGLVCWWAYAYWQGLPAWIVYKSLSALGLVLFCFAALKPGPALKVAQ